MGNAKTDRRALYITLLKRMGIEEVMDELRDGVRSALLARGTTLSPNDSVLFDEKKGDVVVISGGIVITGDDARVANEAATGVFVLLSRRTTDALPAPTPESAPQSAVETLIRKDASRRFGARVFWALNGLFLLYWAAWFTGFIFSPAFREWFNSARSSGDFGAIGLLLFLLLPAIPLSAVIGELLRKKGIFAEFTYERAIIRFEIPALVTAFIVNIAAASMPLTPSLRLVFLVFYALLIVYWYCESFRVPFVTARGALVRAIVGAAGLSFVGYVALLFAPLFYLYTFEVIMRGIGYMDIFSSLSDPLMAALFFLYAALYITPFVVIWIFAHNFIRAYRELRDNLRKYSVTLAHAISYGTPALFFVLMLLASWQFSAQTYTEKLLYLAQETGGYEAEANRARELVFHKENVDKALRNSMFASTQYLLKSSDLENCYRAQLACTYLRIVGFPFVLDDKGGTIGYSRYGGFYGPQYDTLARGYRMAFGEELTSITQKKSEPTKQVHLLSRDVQALTSGSPIFAKVTVTDSLGTNLPSDQEAVYEFSLPEEAIVTGLKLGASLEYTGEIAPRGAAQATYNNQVRQRRDPALLEQTGPRQYRLRVFPVPGTSENAARTRRESVEGETQRVQFTYFVARDAVGIPLPVYTKEHNLRTDGADMSVAIDGKGATLGAGDTHIPDKKKKEELCVLSGANVTTPAGEGSVRVVYAKERNGTTPPMPLCDGGDKLGWLTGKKIVFLVDTAYVNHDGALKGALDELRELPNAFFQQNSVSYLTFSSDSSRIIPLRDAAGTPKASDLIYFGKGNAARALRLVVNEYDAAVMLLGSDTSFADERVDLAAGQTPHMALVFVHADGKFPAYPAMYGQHIVGARSVGVASGVTEALAHLATPPAETKIYTALGSYWALEAPKNVAEIGDITNVVERLQPSVVTSIGDWPVAPPSLLPSREPAPKEIVTDEDIMKAMAGRIQIMNASGVEQKYASPYYSPLSAQDSLYGEAKRLHIVTSLSSLIALVNSTQQQMLNQQSMQADRYSSDQSLVVTTPGFASPLMGKNFGLGTNMRQSSLGISGTVTTTSAPAINVVPSDSSGGTLRGPMGDTLYAPGSSYTFEGYKAPVQGVAVSASGDDLIPKLVVLVSVFVLLGAGGFFGYRYFSRNHKVG